jgi:NADPH-dependent 2,4-dienoyl-CoA reductase/sulfur reductase-like enzyme
VRCDAAGRTGVPGVVAVGDCAEWYEPRLGRHLRVEHWTAAVERPRIAVRSLLTGEAPAAPARLPYFWSDQYGLRIQFAGLTRDGDEVTVEEGEPGPGGFLAVYRRAGRPVAVLGVDRVGPFARWRRQLERAGTEASQTIDHTVGSAP